MSRATTRGLAAASAPALVMALALALAAPGAAAARCRILVTNDDGVGAPGLAALYRGLRDLCDVLVVAPSQDRSGYSHAIPDARSGFKARPFDVDGAPAGYAVEGTPAEAAALGVVEFGRPQPFDLVVSGLNAGENTGLANLYSGTVNAGMEAVVRGVPAIAVSQADGYGGDYAYAVAFTRRLVRAELRHRLPRGVMLNVNIPKPADGEVEVVEAGGLDLALEGFSATPLASGETLFRPKFAPAPGPGVGDVAAFRRGRITITPLALDRTDRKAMASLRRWRLTGGGER